MCISGELSSVINLYRMFFEVMESFGLIFRDVH